MPKRCSACNHERRVDLDFDLLAGGTSRAVGETYGLSKPTITGHRRSGHHLLQTPRQGTTGPHNSATLLTRIMANLDDPEALKDLRIAASTLPHGERRLLVAELRLRAAGRGEVAEPERRVA